LLPFWKFLNTLPDNLTKISKSGKKLKEIRLRQKEIVNNVVNLKYPKLLLKKMEKRKPTRLTRKKTLKVQL
jgi:hypothetical protein